MCALGQVLRLSIACLYGVVGGGWALSAPLAQKGNSYHFQSHPFKRNGYLPLMPSSFWASRKIV